MLSIIITAKEEAKTVGEAIKAFLSALEYYKANKGEIDFEIIVVAPDEATLQAAEVAFPAIILIQDKYGGGKAAAMNLAIHQAKGEKIIFSDGDVKIVDQAIVELLKMKADAVTGRPVVAKTQRVGQYKYWQESLVDMAHWLRLKRDKNNEFLLLSGYLFLIKREIFKKFRFYEELVNEDEYLSYWLWKNGYKVSYAPAALVEVKYADNCIDWIKQKTRSLAGGYQIPKEWRRQAMRNFSRESLSAWQMWKKYVNNWREASWMLNLFFIRLYVWLLAWWKFKVLKLGREAFWQRVESTK